MLAFGDFRHLTFSLSEDTYFTHCRSAGQTDFAWVGAVRQLADSDTFYSLYDYGTELTYTNFDAGTDFTSVEGECVVVDRGGVWYTRPCTQLARGVLCQRDQGIII